MLPSGYICMPSFNSSLENVLDAYFKEKEIKVTVGVPTKGRYETLSNTLLSIVFQTVKPNEIIIVDDNEESKDLREILTYQGIFKLFDYYKISWRVVFGRHKGQNHSHQIVQEIAQNPIIWRIDDDEIAEKNVLQGLLDCLGKDVGAVGGLVPQDCPAPLLPSNAANIISDLNKPNIQWFQHPPNKEAIGALAGMNPDAIEVDHLTSSFIYRKGIAKFELSLSPAAFREETLFTYEIKRKGFRLLVNPNVTTWHFRGQNRHQNIADWEADDKFFQEKLRNWGIDGKTSKIIVADMGKGDHIVLKSLIPDLKNKYGKITIASCFSDVFMDDDVEQISIAEAQQRLGDLTRFNIYKNMIDWKWERSLEEAFRKLYDVQK